MMTRKERLKRCYYHEELDRPAVYSRTGFPRNDSSYDSHALIVCPSASPYIPGAGEKCFQQYRAMIETVIRYNR